MHGLVLWSFPHLLHFELGTNPLRAWLWFGRECHCRAPPSQSTNHPRKVSGRFFFPRRPGLLSLSIHQGVSRR